MKSRGTLRGFVWMLVTTVLGCSPMTAVFSQETPKATPESVAKKRPGPQLVGSEKGSFKIFVEGEQKGTEEFEIVPWEGRFAARAKIQLTVTREDKPVQYSIESDLQLKAGFEPLRYQLIQKYEGNVATALLDFNPGKTTAEFKFNDSSEKREYQLASDVALLDDNVFHHYVLLARRYDFDKGGLQEFSAFVPQESLGGILRILDKGEEKTSVGGKTMPLRHLVVDTNDLKLDLYLEGNDHRLVKLEVPSSNVLVIRQS